MGLIGFYIAQGYKIAYMALLGPFWPLGILLKRYNEVILGPNGTAGIQAKVRIQADLANLYRNPFQNLPQYPQKQALEICLNLLVFPLLIT